MIFSIFEFVFVPLRCSYHCILGYIASHHTLADQAFVVEACVDLKNLLLPYVLAPWSLLLAATFLLVC